MSYHTAFKQIIGIPGPAFEDVAEKQAKLADRGQHCVPCPCQECSNEAAQMGDQPPRSSKALSPHSSSVAIGNPKKRQHQ